MCVSPSSRGSVCTNRETGVEIMRDDCSRYGAKILVLEVTEAGDDHSDVVGIAIVDALLVTD